MRAKPCTAYSSGIGSAVPHRVSFPVLNNLGCAAPYSRTPGCRGLASPLTLVLCRTRRRSREDIPPAPVPRKPYHLRLATQPSEEDPPPPPRRLTGNLGHS